MANLPVGVEAQVAAFTQLVSATDTALRDLSTAPSLDGLQPLQQSQLQLCLAQTINVLFHLLLKASGKDSSDHPLQKELDRLKQYKKKVDRDIAEQELRHSRPTISLNIAAANRFIDHAIPDLTQEQRGRLREQNREKRVQEQGPRKKQRKNVKEATLQFLDAVSKGEAPGPN